jgi:hypothetical protein
VSGGTESSAVLSFEAVVTDIRLESRVEGRARWQIALDRTLFSTVAAPTGVLEAVARSGARLVVPVLEVVEEAGVVWHVADKPLTEGTSITGWLGG